MKNKNIIILMSLSLFVTVAAFAHNKDKQEGLYGFSINNNHIEIIVKNNGCTKPQDFRLDELDMGDYVLLNVVRTKPDRCRAMSRPMTINLAIKAKHHSDYKINNSFVRNNLLRKSKGTVGEK